MEWLSQPKGGLNQMNMNESGEGGGGGGCRILQWICSSLCFADCDLCGVYIYSNLQKK